MRKATLRSRVALFATLLFLPLANGCATRTAPQDRAMSEVSALAPILSVERFLQAVNAEDFDAMAGLFGNSEGPVKGDFTEIELRMATIAQILQHEDYEIASDDRQPGREHPTRRIGVDLTISGRRIPDVAFEVVRTGSGAWMVERIDLEKVTG